MEEGCWVSGVSKNGIVGAQGGPTLFGSHCTKLVCAHPLAESSGHFAWCFHITADGIDRWMTRRIGFLFVLR